MPKPVIVYSTCGKLEVAEEIAALLVEDKLAACVNIVDNVKSVYRWKSEVQTDHEVMMMIKTTSNHVQKIQHLVKKHSGYELPEVIAVDITDGSEEYLGWIAEETD